MPTLTRSVLGHLYEVVLLPPGGPSDGQLLECFLTGREEAAFAALVRRHGPMVLGVCRRVLRHEQDAEDAFQATFLVLARKAGTLTRGELLGNWLYGVAYRTALKARTAAVRRRARETPLIDLPQREASGADDWQELCPLLDRELTRLPDCYRAPVVLCELEGKSRKEAARLLGLAEGTLSSRLARARTLLARRLGRHRLTLAGPLAGAAGLCAVPLAGASGLCGPPAGASGWSLAGAAGASVPASLVASTVRATAGAVSVPVIALTEGVLRAMLLTKCKIAATLILALLVAGLGAGSLGQRALADKPNPAPAKEEKADKKDKPEVGPTVPGTVIAVDEGKHTITVGVYEGGKKGVEKIFDLAKDVKVLLYDEGMAKGELKEGKLADVVEGNGAHLQLAVDKKTVLSITMHGGSLHGAVKTVDAVNNVITVTAKGKDGLGERKLKLSKDVKVWLTDGLKKGAATKEGKVTDLAEDTPVRLQLAASDRELVTSIHVQGQTIFGGLKGVDTGNNTITLIVKENGELVDKTFPLSKDARVTITDGKTEQEAKLGDLTGELQIRLQLSVFDNKTVVRVQAHKPE
jgi:RNA polymerase sigma factor (sigma-70 family)